MNDRPQPPVEDPDGYSATELASHWFQRPTLVTPDTADAPDLAEVPAPDDRAASGRVEPDRVEGDILRFGPGVTAAALRRHATFRYAPAEEATLPVLPPPPAPSRARRFGALRRYALPTAVLLAVLLFLAWQRFGPSLAVREVTVEPVSAALGCGSTADIVGVVGTDGRAGTLRYRWVRSDGTRSGVLREEVAQGQKQARLHLLWTFKGEGLYRAEAELRIVSPGRHTARTEFTYRCS